MSIVVTGNPGVGKHTIAKEIAKNLEFNIIDINQIAKDTDLFEENQDANDTRIDLMKSRFVDEYDPSGEGPTGITPLHPDDVNL